MLFKGFAFFHRLEAFVVEIIPLAVMTFGIGHIMAARERAVVHCQRKQTIVGAASQCRINTRKAVRGHVETCPISGILLDLPEVRVKALDVEDKHLG